MRKRHKLAVATEDGERVSPHFSMAREFYVYTVEEGRVVDEEVRENFILCSRKDGGDAGGCWDIMKKILFDAKVVICAGMGENAYVGVLRRDILPLVTEEVPIGQAVLRYLRGELRENRSRVHPS